MALKSKTFSPDGTWALAGQMVLSGGAAKLVAAPSYSEDFEGLAINSTPPGWTGANAATCQVKSLDGQKVMEISGGNPAGAYYSVSLPDGCMEWQTTASDNNRLVFGYQKWDLAAGGGYGACFAPSSSLLALGQNAGTPPGFSVDYPFYGDAEQNTQEFTLANFPAPNVLKLQCTTNANGDVESFLFLNGVKQRYHKDTFRRYTGHQMAFGGQFYYTVGYIKFWPTQTGGFTTPAITPISVASWTSVAVNLDGKAMRSSNLSSWLQYKVDSGAWTTVPDSGSLAGAPAGASIFFRANNNLMNEMDASSDVAIYNLSVQIDGVWDAAAGVPPAPAGLSVTSQSSSAVNLAWTASAGADGYSVYRALPTPGASTFGAFVRLTAAQSGVTFTDNTGIAGVTYIYAVTALAGNNESGPGGLVVGIFSAFKKSGLVRRDFLGPLQKAIYGRLKATAITGINGGAVPVYDSVPQDANLPYVVVGLQQASSPHDTKSRAGQEVSSTVEIYSKYFGMKELNTVASQVGNALTSPRLDLSSDGFNVIFHVVEMDQDLKEPDGLTVRRILRLRFVLEDLTTAQP